MPDSVRPHRQQPTRLSHPWDSPGKNTGVGCHFLLQCMKVKSESEVAQSCPTPSDPMDCSLTGSYIHGIFQARVLEWGAIAFSAQGCHRAPGWTPCVISNFLLAIYFTYGNIHVSVFLSQFLLTLKKSESVSQLVVSDSLQPHRLWPAMLFCPWNSPGKKSRVGNLSFRHGILTQGSNPGLLHCRQILYHLSHQGSPNTTM